MRKATCFAALLISGLASAGCESRLDQNYRLSDPQRGIVLIRVADIRSVPEGADLNIQQYDPATSKLLSPGRFFKNADYWEPIRLKNGFSAITHGENGGFFATEAAPGSYIVERLIITTGRIMNNICMEHGTVAFDVKPGAITYIGNYTVSQTGLSFAGVHKDLAQVEIARHPNLTALPLETGLKFASVVGSYPGPNACYADDARLTFGQLTQPSAPLSVNVSNSFIALAGAATGDARGAKEKGDSLVNSTGIKGVFENVTTGAVTTVRHMPSGLVCINPQVVLTPKAQVTAFDPGTQAGCISRESGVQDNLIVIPNRGSLSADEALTALMRREQTLQPTLEARKTVDALGQRSSGVDYVSGSLASAAGSAPRYMHFAVATVNGWVVFDQTIGSQDQAADCDRVAVSGLKAAVANIHKPGA